MEDASLRLVSTFRHLGTQATHGARRGPEPLQGRHTCHAQADFESEVPLGQGGGRAGGRWFPVALRRRHVALLSGTLTHVRWWPGHILASSQEVCWRLGIPDFQEAVSVQRLRLAARLVNAAPSLMALLQSVAG